MILTLTCASLCVCMCLCDLSFVHKDQLWLVTQLMNKGGWVYPESEERSVRGVYTLRH